MRTALKTRTQNGRPSAEAVGTPVVVGEGPSFTADTRESNRARRRTQWEAKACECRKKHNRYLDRLMEVVDARLAAWARGEPTPHVPAMEGAVDA